MTDKIITVADGFWNIRGSFRIKGLIDVGTQVSLVRLASGKFVFLDSYSLDRATMREVEKLTGGAENVAAILNVHPFHTVHVERMHELFPQAALHGTARHRSRFPSLPWSKTNCEDRALHRRYAGDFEFSVPRGVDFISADENVHFSSVLVFHPESSALHVDDTLIYLRLPGPLRALGLGDSVSFHPTLASALEPLSDAIETRIQLDEVTALCEERTRERDDGLDQLKAAHGIKHRLEPGHEPGIDGRACNHGTDDQ